MKKIFSAFLLMTMMVASVGSFVSCSDIEESIAAVDEATKDNAASIKDLEGKIAALQTALQTAQSEAAAAKAEANAAKQAAATAKAEAIAAALAEIEKVNGDVDAVNAEIKKINDALAGCATKEAVELLQATIDEYKALIDANGDATTANAEAIAAIEEALAALGENVTPEQLAEVVAKMTAIDQALVAFQNRLQSVSYVPEWVAGPTAVLFEENKEYGYVHMSYEVAPAAYASKITAENTKLVGVALKGVEVEEHDVKILSADPETGIVEVIAYIGVDSEVWKAEEEAAVALRVVAEDAQFTSAYTNVNVLGTGSKKMSINDVVFFGTYNEDDKFVTNVKNDAGVYQPAALTHEVAYDTAVAESEVALFEGLVARVNVPGFFEYLPVEEAAEMFGIEIEVTEKLSSFATKYFVTTVPEYNWIEDEDDEPETPAFVVAKDQTLDITVKFNETVVDSLKKAETLPSYVGQTAKAELKPGFFQVNGKKSATFAGLTAYYVVDGLEKTIELVLNNDEDLNIEWSTENYDNNGALKAVVVKDIDVTGGDARHLLGQECTMTAIDEDGEVITNAPVVKVKFISVDNADVTVAITEWPEEAAAYTYTFEGTYTDDETEATETTVKVTFDLNVTIEAAPEQIGEVPTSAVTVNLVKSGIEVKPNTDPWPATNVALTGVVEKLLPYYKEYFESEKKAKTAIENQLKAGKAVTINVVDAATGEIDATKTITGAATYKYSVNATTKAETSAITIPYNAEVYGKITKQYVQFSFNVEFFGVVANVTADCEKVSEWVNYSAPTIELVAGKYNPKTLQGTNPLKWETINTWWESKDDEGKVVKNYYDYVSVNWAKANTGYNFGGANLKLSDYVKIANGPTDLSGYMIRVKMTSEAPYYTTPDPADATKTIKHYYYAEDNTAKTQIPTLNHPAVAEPLPLFAMNAVAEAPADTIDLADGTKAILAKVTKIEANVKNTAVYYFMASELNNLSINWNNSHDNSITVSVELFKKPADLQYAYRVDAIDTFPVEFIVAAPVSFETVETEAYEYKHGVATEINLVDHITVTDVFGKEVYNPYGDWSQKFFGYRWVAVPNGTATAEDYGEYVTGTEIAPGAILNFDLFKMYGQTLEFAPLLDENDKEIANTFIKETVVGLDENVDYTFNRTTGKITLNTNLADLTGTAEFTVRVKLNHMLDNYKADYKTITFQVVNAE